MPEIVVGCALSDVNRADLPAGWRVPEQLAVYLERSRERLGEQTVLFELQPEDLWTVPATFPDQFIPRKNNRWWRAVQSHPDLLGRLRAQAAARRASTDSEQRRALDQFLSQVRSDRGDQASDGVCRIH